MRNILLVTPSNIPLNVRDRVLGDVHETLSSQGRHSYLSQIVHQQRDRENIARLSERIDAAYNIIMVRYPPSSVIADRLIHDPISDPAACAHRR